MTPERWREIKRALSEVVALPPADREAYLLGLREQDPDVAREVESLLPHDTESHFLDRPAIAIPGLTAGATFGPYLLESALGEGGMGMVYLARDTTLDRPVALKFLSRALEDDEDARRRFLREAKAAAALDHPYICKIYQTGEHGGRPFIAMEYVRGETLRQGLDAGPLLLADALRIVVEVLEALETAHAAQIVHRDLKPSNIMLTADGHVKVLDFGLAKRVEAPEYANTESALTDAGTVQGTVAYMSPEQVRGENVDLRSDLFSVGVVLHECLTGGNPFLARSSLETASQILHYAPPVPSAASADVPPVLDRIVQRLLAKPVEERYASAADLRVDLARVRDAVERGEPLPDEAPATPVPPVRAFVSRRTAIGTLAAGAALALGGAWRWRAGAGRPKSLAVLPFIKDDNSPDYLATGIPIEVTRRLSNAGVRVIPWETAMRFRETSSAVDVAAKLGVTSVLIGSLQTISERLRVNVSLVDGSSGFVSWSEEQEFGLPDLFDVQTRIAQRLAESLGYQLTGDVTATLARSESSSTEAWDFYLQGARYLYDPNGGKQELVVALAYFEKALALDPGLVAAHVGAGAVRLETHWNGWGGGEAGLTLAARNFAEAYARDPKDMRAWRGRMLIEFYRGNGNEALNLSEQAAHAGGQEIETLLARAEAFADTGPSDLALPFLNRVLELDQGNQAAAWLRLPALSQSDRLRETVTAALDYHRRFGDDVWVAVVHSNALAQLNDVNGASAVLEPFVDRLMTPSLQAENVTSFELAAVIGAGVFAAGTGRVARAQELWRRGLELTLEGQQEDADSGVLKLFASSFRGFAGDATFPVEAERTMKEIAATSLNPWVLVYLALAHGYRGDTVRALEVLRYGLSHGRLTGRVWLTVWAPALKDAPGFAELLRDYDREAERRRRRYGRAS
ncbi:MAG TPA: protein kinase [Vicinamibacterales bacterium]|nr:protein kinase [Vicinamibacterales bacterium]